MRLGIGGLSSAAYSDDWLTNGCSVLSIMESMDMEQRDHQHCHFGDTYIRYRKVVAEWMVDVCEHFALHPTTTHAAIAYLDRLQPNEKFSRFEWQMLAISCILIASKYNECEDHVPDLSTMEDITQQVISNETLLQYEMWALKRMGFKLNARTPMAFLSCHMTLNGGLLRKEDELACVEGAEGAAAAHADATAQANLIAQSTATSCLLQIEYKPYLASDMALAIAHYARENVQGLRSPAWTDTLEREIGSVNKDSVQEILSRLRSGAMPEPPSAGGFSNRSKGSSASPTSVDVGSPTAQPEHAAATAA